MTDRSLTSVEPPAPPLAAPAQTRRPAAERLARWSAPTWLLGALAALASWNVAFGAPFFGIDASWNAGLSIAAHRGLDFGTQVVFTYGPLGFLRVAQVWYQDLAILGFVYSGALFVALAISLVWSLRRSVNGAVALVAATVVLIATPTMEVAVVLTALWCLATLSTDPPAFAGRLVLLGGAALGATESLISLRTGPLILAMGAVTLAAGAGRRRDVALFVAVSVAVVTVLWLALGQPVGALLDYARNSAGIVSGYSEAMGVPAASPLYLPIAIAVGAALVALAVVLSPAGLRRAAAGVVVGLAAFAIYKEAVVRADSGHQLVFFATAAGLGAALPFGARRVTAVATVGVLAAMAFALPRAEHPPVDLNPLTHGRLAVNQLRTLVSPARRTRLADEWRFGLAVHYRLEPSTLRLLKGRTVHIDPWETAVVWTYGLAWDPPPVFQDYQAYTADLDRLNARHLRSANGPERILRENTRLVDPEYPTPAIDLRVPSWDPPEQALAMACNYVALQTTVRWQVLGKVANRCRAPRPLGSVTTRDGGTVAVPPAPRGAFVVARIHGAGVSGLERLRSFAYRARFRYLQVNGAATQRLVPGTAADGLIMRAGAGADLPPPFSLSPEARTIRLEGASGPLSVDFYRVPVG